MGFDLAPIKIVLGIGKFDLSQCIRIKRGFINSLKVMVTFLDKDNKPFIIPTGTTAKVRMLKPDTKKVLDDTEQNGTVTGNKVIFDITTQMQAYPGTGALEIILFNGGETVTSSTCGIEIKENVHDDSGLESTDEWLTVLNTLAELELKIQDATTATNNANSAAEELRRETLIIYLPNVPNYAAIATTYPNPEIGWATVAEDTHIRWRWNGTEWMNVGIVQDIGVANNTTPGTIKGGGNIIIAADGQANYNMTGDSKNNIVAFSEYSTDTDIASGDTHATLFGKILKRLKTFGAEVAISSIKGKKILVLGDSISAYHYGWVDALTDKLNGIATVTNMSLSGRTISGTGGMADISSGINTVYDIVILFGGVNDYLTKVPFGDINTASDITTFNGALKKLYNNLWSLNNATHVYVISPTKTQFNPENNTDNLVLNHYRTILHTHCIYNGWHFIDGYNDAPFINAYNNLGSPWLSDGLHFSSTYSPYFAEYILKNILSVNPSKIDKTINRINLYDFANGINAYLFYYSTGFVRLFLFGDITINAANTLQSLGYALPTWMRPDILTSLHVTMRDTGASNFAINKAYAGLGNDGIIYIACDSAVTVKIYSDTILTTKNLIYDYSNTY